MHYSAFAGLFAVALAIADAHTPTNYAASASDFAQYDATTTRASGGADHAPNQGLSHSATASAVPLTEEARELPRRPSFAFEQCANACRMALDNEILQCDGYRQPGYGPERPNCRAELSEAYNSCLNACPRDTGDGG